ncbi:MAG TPA: Xaa-Pro dipeptidyl-peptidase [Rugosimonospora sp.]|nr:Xaa-Pro dipeptidyl-peptidase [Rugosimonospora sp.]
MVESRRNRSLLGGLLALAAVAAVCATTPGPAVAAPAAPFIRGTSTVPVYSYANAIRESVWVVIPADNDGDGKPDRVAVDLVRPREAAAAHVRVPVIMEASPYYACCGRGNESEVKTYDGTGTIAKEPLFYDNYFVPRGYAFVAVDLAGTNRSTGCEDVGGPEEVLSAKAVIDWLNGRARAYHADGSPAVADWTTGRVGMIGKSWDGTIANAVAATGVPGLATIVPISGISSWYDYMRFNGVLRSTQYPQFLQQLVSGRPAGACDAVLAHLNGDSAEATGDFNQFWAQRDYRLDASKVRASVFVVHGINDTNVTTSQFALWWAELARRGVPRKIWLSQLGHVDPFDFRRATWVSTLQQWFDHYLQGLANGIDRAPQASLETGPGVWVDQPTWPPAAAHPVQVRLGSGDGTTGTLNGIPAAPGTVRSYHDNTSLTEAVATANPGTAVDGRLVFLSAPLSRDVRIAGIPTATLRVRVNRPTTQLTARLVDYGTAQRVDYLTGEGVHTLATQSCWGASTTFDDACYFDTAENVVTSDHAVVTRGWQDAAHYRSLWFRTPLLPDHWYTITVPLQATDATLAAGHVLGLVLQQSDLDYASSDNPGSNPLPTETDATVELDLHASSLTLPQVGRAGLPVAGPVPPVVSAPAAARAALLAPQWMKKLPD